MLNKLTLLPLVATILTYQVGLYLQKKIKSPLCNPLLISIILIIGLLLLTGYPTADYQEGMKFISWLLTPTTICFAVPLYEQLQLLKKDLKAILAGVCAGTLASLGFLFGLSRVMGLNDVLTASLLPKSVTNAIGIILSQQARGDVAITTAAICITGILGGIIGPMLCRIFRITSPIAQGVAFGTSSHVMGTAKARELSELTGAVSSLSLTVAGILTSLIFPLFFH